ncbi:TetR family transcriptional regulator C-terminal domain-containing protein [Rhodoligotrophos defluvii]|uniref:TetR family transcriptional regulator C-terminal domain-containing protein n=1 Tax=Rhodoligotrophos defluvii TaxID=2561934 RepID=UPI0010C93573|nr:TetR family transcriptional regulator C-terminal domain-containing protein [Rhodoligotrophos defluvii]
MARRSKFQRKLPEERRKTLIAATLKCLGEQGHAGLSVRKISAEAGISIGLINHHYPSKDALVAQAYETLAMALLDAAKDAVAQAAPAPRDRLNAFFTATLAAPSFDQGTFRAWVVFWGMIGDSKILAETHDRTYGEFRAFLESLLLENASHCKRPIADIRLAAIGLSALMDGLWLERCLNPATFSIEEALQLCHAWADSIY